MDKDHLIYKVEYIEGVEIDTLCGSLKAIGDEYRRFTNNSKKLVVKEIRKGSGIFEFIEQIVIPVFASMEATNTLVQFGEYISNVKDVIIKKKDKLPNNIPLTKTSVENVNSMFSPVINGNNNTVNIYIGTNPVVSMGQSEYQEMKTRSAQTLKELKSNKQSFLKNQIYNKVLFQWVQTRFDSTKFGNRGVINQIQEKSAKVIFADDNSNTKAEMTTSSHGIDWQKVKYFVDVETIVSDGNIVAYKILKNYPNDCIIEGGGNELFG